MTPHFLRIPAYLQHLLWRAVKVSGITNHNCAIFKSIQFVPVVLSLVVLLQKINMLLKLTKCLNVTKFFKQERVGRLTDRLTCTHCDPWPEERQWREERGGRMDRQLLWKRGHMDKQRNHLLFNSSHTFTPTLSAFPPKMSPNSCQWTASHTPTDPTESMLQHLTNCLWLRTKEEAESS